MTPRGKGALGLAVLAVLISMLSLFVVLQVAATNPPVSERTACLDTMDGGPMP